MNAPNAIIKTTVASADAAASPRILYNPARRLKPFPLPLRPLVADRFKPPKGQKKIFLPNFTLAFLRTPRQPPNFASFLTPLWLNKLDLKDYLYNLYAIQALRVRSFIIHGKITRDLRTGRWKRGPAQKKMTVELVKGVQGQGPFVWPAEFGREGGGENKNEKDRKEEGVRKREEEREERVLRERMKGDEERVVRGREEEAERLRERARLLVEGKVRWRPGWVVDGGVTTKVAMGRVNVGKQKAVRAS